MSTEFRERTRITGDEIAFDSRHRMQLTPMFFAVKNIALREEHRVGEFQFFHQSFGIERWLNVDLHRHLARLLANTQDLMAASQEELKRRAEVIADFLMGQLRRILLERSMPRTHHDHEQ